MKDNPNRAFNTDFLLRYLEGNVSDIERRQFVEDLKQSRQLQEELTQLKATQALLQQVAAAASEDVLKPFFTDRLMKNLVPGSVSVSVEEELASFMSLLFRPIAIAGLVLALCLAVYNINLSNGYSSDPSTAESILAMPPVTSMAVYELDYYSAQSETLP